MRWLLFFALMVGCVSIVMDYLSLQDRQDLRIRQDASRQLLDARARLQINAFNAILERRTFTEAEIQEMERLWKQAEYDLIQERFLSAQQTH